MRAGPPHIWIDSGIIIGSPNVQYARMTLDLHECPDFPVSIRLRCAEGSYLWDPKGRLSNVDYHFRRKAASAVFLVEINNGLLLHSLVSEIIVRRGFRINSDHCSPRPLELTPAENIL